jgi:hypothetical protein
MLILRTRSLEWQKSQCFSPASVTADKIQHVSHGFLQWCEGCLRAEGDHCEPLYNILVSCCCHTSYQAIISFVNRTFSDKERAVSLAGTCNMLSTRNTFEARGCASWDCGGKPLALWQWQVPDHFECTVYGEARNNYKLIIPFSDPFLYIISTSTDYYIHFARYNLNYNIIIKFLINIKIVSFQIWRYDYDYPSPQSLMVETVSKTLEIHFI